MNNLFDVLRNGEKERIRYASQHRRSDGTTYPVEVHAHGARMAHRRVVVEFVLDISERAQAEAEREALRDQLRQAQKMETLGTLAGGIAHDFNNILTPITLNTHMVRNSVEAGSDTYDRLTRIYDAANRAKDLVNRMLTFSRVTTSQMKPLCLDDVLADAMKLIRASVPPIIHVHEELDTDRALIIGDETALCLVAMNLCTNAHHAIGDNPGTIAVRTKRITCGINELQGQPDLAPGTFLEIMVEDSGHGMDETTQKRIFEPFFTSKEAGHGTGLGLSVVHGIVLSHRGDIRVESQPGAGSTFRILLPVVTASRAAAPQSRSIKPGDHERLLLVDDNRDVAQLCQELLGMLNYEITICTSAPEALDLIDREPGAFDLLITDQMMPELRGTELARRVQELAPNLPIIMITAFTQAIDEEECRAAGISDVVTKPLLPDELAVAVRRALDTR